MPLTARTGMCVDTTLLDRVCILCKHYSSVSVSLNLSDSVGDL